MLVVSLPNQYMEINPLIEAVADKELHRIANKVFNQERILPSEEISHFSIAISILSQQTSVCSIVSSAPIRVC